MELIERLVPAPWQSQCRGAWLQSIIDVKGKATKSQQVSFQLSLLVTMLPALLLSGFFFPIENMPPILQAVTYLVPARYFMVVIRGIFLKGVGLAVLWKELVFLAIFAALMLLASAVKFQKRIT